VVVTIMKRLIVLCAAALVCTSALAQPQPIKDAMHKLYGEIEADYNKGAADAVTAYFSPDYVWKMVDGKTLNYNDAKKEIKSELSLIQSGKWHVDVLNVVGSGPVAMAVVQYSFKGQMMDDSKRNYTAELVSTERQNWIRGANGWRQISDEIVNVKWRGDGQKAIANIYTSDKPAASGPAGTPAAN